MDVYTVSGKKVVLSEPALSSGGEGAVYELVGYPKKVAKIYHDKKDAKLREGKIKEMVKISATSSFVSTQITNEVAWPLSPLFDKSHNFIGFGMNRISAATELDDLYVYPPKKNMNVTIVDKIDCAISLCDVIDRLHQTGQVFGDFNPNNIKINNGWKVSFVDADSYHVKSNGKTYPCRVCAPGYVAPEVIKACKGTTYEACTKTTFTKQTDYFALSIHIFRMLMNGCHPYNCERRMKKVGSTPAPKSTDKRVESGETPFFQNISNFTAPHYAPDINSLPPYIVTLFRRAFVDGHKNAYARPDAIEWKNALQRYRKELRRCNTNSSHYFWNNRNTCPYCEADTRYQNRINPFSKKGSQNCAKNNGIVTNPPVISVTNNTTATNQSQKPAGATTVATTTKYSTTSTWFWLITLVLSCLLVWVAGTTFLPGCYWNIFDELYLVEIGVWGSIISGIAGCAVYNHWWSAGKKSGRYAWWEYILSLGTAASFMAFFAFAMLIIMLLLYVLAYILGFFLIIGIIVGFLSGG